MRLLAEWIQHKKNLVNLRTEQLKLFKKEKKKTKQNKSRKHSICEKQIRQPKFCLYGDPEASKEEEMG